MQKYHRFYTQSVLPVDFFNMPHEEVVAIHEEFVSFRDANLAESKTQRDAAAESYKRLSELLELDGVKTAVGYGNKRKQTKLGKLLQEELNAAMVQTVPYSTTPHECTLPNGEKYRSYVSPVTLPHLHEQAHKRWVSVSSGEERAKKEFSQALEWIVKNEYTPKATTREGVIAEVYNEAGKRWLEENYPAGSEVSCPCDECGTYIVGERRCNCGNIRVSVSVDGVFGKFYVVTERY